MHSLTLRRLLQLQIIEMSHDAEECISIECCNSG